MNAVAPAVRERLARPAGAASRSRLYLGTAVTMAAVAFAGFAPSYWAPMAAGTLSLDPAVHVHGSLFFLWTLCFVAQTALVAGRRTAWHRKLGLAGVALAALMVFSGVVVQIVSLRAGLAGPQPEIARTVAGGLFLVANQALRAVIARTGPWAAFTDWLAALGG